MFKLVGPLLHALDAEKAHHLAIAGLKTGLYPTRAARSTKALESTVAGLRFPNPVGLAAGFDKNAEVPDAILGLGFGFTEIGTVTPKPQAGNPKPRLFRLPDHQGVINRMGFNNDGHATVLERLKNRTATGARAGIVGVNIGANKDSADRIADYVAGIRAFRDVASYFTVNISSPNTPGLRALQEGEELEALLDRVNEARGNEEGQPMFLKIAPDLSPEQLEHVAQTCPGRVDGVIVSNTTLSRDGVSGRHADEAGGLSGKPLFERSTRALAQFYNLTGGKLPLIGVGGIASAADAYAKIKAGASLVQVYSAMVYEGPELANAIVSGLPKLLARDGHATISDAVGTGVTDWL